MREMPLEAMMRLMRALSDWAVKLRKDDGLPIKPEWRKHQIGRLKNFLAPLLELGFIASVASINKIIAVLEKEGSKAADLRPPVAELIDRLEDEAKSLMFFALTPRESELFSYARKGWERSIERFPAIVDDVEEACKCFALSRYAAAVFHSIQIVETGLIDFGRFLKISDPHSGWTAVSQALKKIIEKKHQDRSRFEKRNFQFLEQMQGSVEGLKNAWRNKISHVQHRLVLMSAEFSPDVAEEILIATRGFMRRLAEDLPPPTKKKKS